MATILVIDDEASICFAFRRFFAKRGYAVETACNAAEALSAARRGAPLVAFVDVKLAGDDDGLSLLPSLRELCPGVSLVVMTAFGSLTMVRRAFDLGACEYLTKPVDMLTAERLVKEASLAAGGGEDEASLPRPELGYVGSSGVMQQLFKRLLKASSLDESVLVTGATGTGKELAAKLLHDCGRRRGAPFVAVNCAALPGNLLESELFGHVRGAFTGATEECEGYCRAAHGGVLFLDEIGELPLAAQVKLLRFLETRQVVKVGAVTGERVDVRVVAATNVELRQAVEEGRFRADLFYRLAVLEIRMPTLDEHREDIPELARHFLHQLSPTLSLSEEALSALTARSWPGNVRELKNAVTQAVLEATSPVLTADCFASGGGEQGIASPLSAYVRSVSLDGESSLERAVSEVERALVRRALEETGGNQSLAAARLGIHRNSLRRLME